LAGYVTLRVLGIPADFTDILLLQTLISFLLYFAPTPGGSGLAELTSAAVMSLYVPRELTPSYTLIWRFINSYATVIVVSLIFWYWLRRGLIGKEEAVGVTSLLLPCPVTAPGVTARPGYSYGGACARRSLSSARGGSPFRRVAR